MNSHFSKAVLLCSGGLDSTTLAYWLQAQNISFVPLFIDYGQHCALKEYQTLNQVLPMNVLSQVEKLDLSSIYRGCSSRLISEANLWKEKVVAEDLYLPYRNLLLLSIGAAFAQSRGINAVYAAFINSNHVKEIDCSTAFFDQLENILQNYGSVKIELPFREMSKYDVAKMGIELKAPIAKTFSCQVSAKIPCGACPNCVERLTALAQLN
jgi:7-cyano-7-deazaguanine synthase